MPVSNHDMNAKDIEKILAAGLISPEQGEAIISHFGLRDGRGRRWLLISLCAVAGGLILAGIIMLIAANWENIPALCKMIASMCLLATFWGGWAWQRESRPWLSEVLGFLGAGMWLVSIALYGQIFQLQNPFVEGCALFFCGIVLFPFISRQRLLVGVVVLCSLILLGAMSAADDSWLGMRRLLGEHIWQDNNGVLTMQSLLLLGGLWWALAERWRVAGERWRCYSRISDILLLVHVCVLQTCMYDVPLHIETPSTLLMGMMVILPIVLLAMHPRGTRWHIWLMPVPVISSLIPLWMLCDTVDSSLLGILVYFGFALLLMFSGFLSARIAWINIGTLMVVFAAIALVADVLDSYTASGVVLIVGGLLLLTLGYLLEKSRRKLIGSVKNTTNNASAA